MDQVVAQMAELGRLTMLSTLLNWRWYWYCNPICNFMTSNIHKKQQGHAECRVFASFASVTQVCLDLDGVDICQTHGWQAHHGFICQVLDLDEFWYEGSANQKNNRASPRAP